MTTNRSQPRPLDQDMRVTFGVDELNGFFQALQPLDIEEIWRVIDQDDEREENP